MVERRRDAGAARQRLHREKLRGAGRRHAMNYARIAAAAVAATVVDGIYGFLVYGTLLANEFAKFPQVYRTSEAGMAYLPGMFVCIFVGTLVAAYIYAKGYDGGSGL